MDATAKLWDVETGEEVATLTVSYLFLAYSSDSLASYPVITNSHSLIVHGLTSQRNYSQIESHYW